MESLINITLFNNINFNDIDPTQSETDNPCPDPNNPDCHKQPFGISIWRFKACKFRV